VQERYGPGARQIGEWWVPPSVRGLLPTVVLVHGGYWRPVYDLHLEDAVAADLAARGYLVWNIDYAAADAPWPATLSDAAAAYDFAARSRYVDPTRVAVVGHSAGGHLALWLASRGRLPTGAPGHGEYLVPALVVAQAPVAALALGSVLGLGSGAVDAFVGGSPTSVPERYAVADPVALAPSGVRTVLVHGAADDTVPLSQSHAYLAAAGPGCTLETVAGGHYDHLDPTSPACEVLRTALATL
jgi:acetyl esterase/lipase